MITNPKISVVMICYNHEKYISQAIDSILLQTYNNFELIIVDDGSTDHTLEIIQRYKDPRMVVITQKNSGPSIALNTGIEHSRGEFIAFMSGDDVSYPNRLDTQIKQIKLQKADILFCPPKIIGPNSENINAAECPQVFSGDFHNTAQLYRTLFYSGNFLCAPSVFCRRTAIEKVGQFKRGLIQLQDFDYWIRACKQKLVIRLHKQPLLKYRYLYGANLSDARNMNRVRVETLEIYREFFDEAPLDLLRESFDVRIAPATFDLALDVEIDKTFLYLNHGDMLVKTIGAERMILQLENDEIYEKLRRERAFDPVNAFQLTNSMNLEGLFEPGKRLSFKKKLKMLLNFGVSEGPRWTETQVKQRLQYYLDQGDFKRALLVRRGIQVYPPGPTLLASLRKLPDRLNRKLTNVLTRRFTAIKVKIKTQINKLIPNSSEEQVFLLRRLYDYCTQAKCILYEAPPERIYLQRPKVIGAFSGDLEEGEAFCPPTYVSVIEDAIVCGGSCLVLAGQDNALSDEMVDFPGDEYGIKPHSVKFRYKDKVILDHKKPTHARIKQGVLISCDHDNNYFHWLVECLPRLAFLDSLEQFKDVPLLVPKGLHKNLGAALKKVNINDRPLTYLEPDVAYHVDHLIYPSKLSRVLDRYGGRPVFSADIVLSHKWVSRVGNLLRGGGKRHKKTWRKLFLTRKTGMRALQNREQLEEMLIEHGFEIIDLDGVSLEFQVKLFSQAAVIIAPTGATLTNMLFCQPGTKVIIFMSNHEVTNFYFWPNLAAIANLDVKIIAGQRLFNLTNYWSVHDDYVVDADLVLEEVKKCE